MILEEAADATALALGGLIALLVAGTEVLAWHWPLVLLGGGLVWGLYRGRKRMPSSYRLLQGIDHRLELADGLSTAYYFSQDPSGRRGSDRTREAQRRAAEALAERIDVRRAVPVKAPRRVYLAGLLLVAAGTLLAARYGFQHSLDLRTPISHTLVDVFRWPAQLARSAAPPLPVDAPEPLSAAEERSRQREQSQARSERPSQGRQQPGHTEEAEPARSTESRRSSETQQDSGEADPRRNGRNESDGENTPAPPPPEQPAGESDSKPSAPEPESDLIRKLQDAFANLLAKLKIPPMAGEGRRTTERSVADGSNSEKRDGHESRQTPGAPEGEAQQSTADPRGNRAPEGARQAQAGRGEGAEQSSEQTGEEQAQSGIGSKDGAKEIKAQQQAEAMGKLSEILGRRAENIKGEVLIEVSSGDLSLETPYSERAAGHREAGGEIHRDEVPLIYHEYLQRYFEQVRKPNGR